MKFAEPMDDDEMDAAARGAGQAAGPDRRAPTRWDLDRTLEIAMDALRLPPRRRRRRRRSPAASAAASRCAGCCCRQPDMLLLDEPTNHLDAESVAWLERHLEEYPGTVVAVTHDRYFLDNVAGLDPRARPRRGHPVRGQLLRLARAEAGAPRRRRRSRRARASARSQRELEWVRMSPRARQAKSKARARRLRAAARRGAGASATTRSRSTSRPARASGDVVVEAEQPQQGLRRPPADRGPHLHAAAGRHRRRHRPQRRGQDDAVPHDRRPGEARRRRAAGRRDRRARLRRPEPRRASTPTKTVWEEISRRPRPHRASASARSTRAPTSPRFNFRGSDQQKQVGDLSGGERNRLHLAKLLQARRQPAAARRADERPRRRHAARARGRAARASPAAPWSSATTAGSSTASRRTSSPSRATRRSRGSRATTRTTRPTARSALGADADQPHRIKYKPLVRQ